MTESVHIETGIPGKSQTNLKVPIGIKKKSDIFLDSAT